MMSDYLSDLIKKGFVKEEISGKKRKQKHYVLSDKGYRYLAEYKTVVQFIESFGLDDEE